MLEEAVGVIRRLWEGGSQDHQGRYYTIEDATIFDPPDPLPEIVVAGSGPASATGKPRYGQATVCWAEDDVAEKVVCGPDVDRHVELVERPRTGRSRPGRVPDELRPALRQRGVVGAA